MASFVWNIKLNPSVEIMAIQRHKIFECMTMIRHEIADFHQECEPIKGLLDQLKQLCQMHFMYEEQLLEELNYPSAAEHKHLHDSFLATIDQFKIENNQCHTPYIFNNFTELRLEFSLHLLNKTMMLCDFIKHNTSVDGASTTH